MKPTPPAWPRMSASPYCDDPRKEIEWLVAAAGAKITREIATTDYGEGYWSDRGYGCTDPEGHQWYFAHRVR